MALQHTNQLIHETSPYLLQHAHNPVNWMPWGEAALQKAKEENKPILLSIGYAACHWCHVMERESFEDEGTAIIMNEHFINIKIDREERPDLDHIYMDAVQAMTGSGGWPLNVFLTPDCKPFYGGTYFPPVRAYNRMSWKETLHAIHQSYQEKKHEIEAQADNLMNHLLNANAFGISKVGETLKPSIFTQENLALIADNILKQADTEWGGFGNAPKFPQTFSIQYLLRHYHFTKDEMPLQQALLSLDKMIYGGIYDQLGGGFARYSTDNKWLAPHFEKMLYDNALLLGVMSEAYQITRNKLYAETIAQTIGFIERELLDESGGFYSALDADSEGVEGKFYTWSKDEVDALLGNDSALYCEYYNVVKEGNWEHSNILWVQEPLQDFAERKAIEAHDLKAIIQRCNTILFAQRSNRIRPQLDDKVLLGWNALTITALCKAYAATGVEHYMQLALNNYHFLVKAVTAGDGSLYHTYKNSLAKIPAFLDDYAYLIQACIHLQEVTGESMYLTKAKDLTEYVIENFVEVDTGFFYYTHQHQKDIIVRKKEVYDGAVPSGNAVMAGNLLYLGIVFNNTNWREHAIDITQNLGTAIIRYPTSFGVWASLVQMQTNGIKEIVATGTDARNYVKPLLDVFLPNKIMQTAIFFENGFPLLVGKEFAKETMFYVCENYTCKEPVNNFINFLPKL
jgi:uncharacterized protein YyaL (SSP411 family)